MAPGETTNDKRLSVLSARENVELPLQLMGWSKQQRKDRAAEMLELVGLRKSYGSFEAVAGLDLTVDRGEIFGFLGPSGAGKSTFANLIPRFYDVTEGRITIDGIDVRDIPQENLRQIVGIALQEAVLFKGDLRFNLKFGQPAAEDGVMFNAAQAADSWGFINGLPQKWEAPVARRGGVIRP